MTAESDLPPCPVCGKQPTAHEAFDAHFTVRFLRYCQRTTDTTQHEVEAAGRTQAEADARWRRLAGGKP